MITLPRTDLAVADDPTGRLLPWMVAVMVFIAALALCGAFAVSEIVASWERDATGTLTIQIEPAGLDAAADTETEARVSAVLEILADQPAVKEARDIPEADLRALMEPWLGAPALAMDLPLPRLIDVTLDESVAFDPQDLANQLAEAVVGVSVDDHRIWLVRLVDLAEGLAVLAYTTVGLVTTATALAVVHATRSGLSMHRQSIEVLHLIGAQDSYIARQFALRSLLLGLKGGLIGLILTVPAITLIGQLTDKLEGGFIPDLSFGIGEIIMLVCLPVGAGLLSMATARITVLRSLARLT